MATKQTAAKAAPAASPTTGFYATDSITYMPASAKGKLKADDPVHNHTLCVRHTYVPKMVTDPVTFKLVPAKKPGTDRLISEREYLEANHITDIDPEQAEDLVQRGCLKRASDVAVKKHAEPALVDEPDEL